MIVDAHCHVAANWYQPVESLLFEMDRAKVDRAVLVQVLGRSDNGYQQGCVADHPDRLRSVVAVDEAAGDAVEQLQRLAEAGAGGVRLRPGTRSPGADPLALWRAAGDLGLAVSCVGPSKAFLAPEFADLVRQLPTLPIVLEHLGGLARPDAEPSADQVFALAASPNLYLKIPGLGQLAPRPMRIPVEGPPFDVAAAAKPITEAVAVFGGARLMWGSDFPPVAAREGYANALAWTREALIDLGEADLGLIFGGVAEAVFWRGGRHAPG